MAETEDEALPGDATIAALHGWVRAKDLEPGAQALGADGRPTRVTTVEKVRGSTHHLGGHGHPGLELGSAFQVVVRPVLNGRVGDAELLPASEVVPQRLFGKMHHRWGTLTEVQQLPFPQAPVRADELWWAAGRYLGSGRLEGDELVLPAALEEAPALRRFLGAGGRRRSGPLQWREHHDGDRLTFRTQHQGVVDWLGAQFGDRPKSKVVPVPALGLEQARREALLNGFLEAFWHGQHLNRKPHQRDDIPAANHTLAISVRALAATLHQPVDIVTHFPFARWHLSWLEQGSGHIAGHRVRFVRPQSGNAIWHRVDGLRRCRWLMPLYVIETEAGSLTVDGFLAGGGAPRRSRPRSGGGGGAGPVPIGAGARDREERRRGMPAPGPIGSRRRQRMRQEEEVTHDDVAEARRRAEQRPASRTPRPAEVPAAHGERRGERARIGATPPRAERAAAGVPRPSHRPETARARVARRPEEEAARAADGNPAGARQAGRQPAYDPALADLIGEAGLEIARVPERAPASAVSAHSEAQQPACAADQTRVARQPAEAGQPQVRVSRIDEPAIDDHAAAARPGAEVLAPGQQAVTFLPAASEPRRLPAGGAQETVTELLDAARRRPPGLAEVRGGTSPPHELATPKEQRSVAAAPLSSQQRDDAREVAAPQGRAHLPAPASPRVPGVTPERVYDPFAEAATPVPRARTPIVREPETRSDVIALDGPGRSMVVNAEPLPTRREDPAALPQAPEVPRLTAGQPQETLSDLLASARHREPELVRRRGDAPLPEPNRSQTGIGPRTRIEGEAPPPRLVVGDRASQQAPVLRETRETRAAREVWPLAYDREARIAAAAREQGIDVAPARFDALLQARWERLGGVGQHPGHVPEILDQHGLRDQLMPRVDVRRVPGEERAVDLLPAPERAGGTEGTGYSPPKLVEPGVRGTDTPAWLTRPSIVRAEEPPPSSSPDWPARPSSPAGHPARAGLAEGVGMNEDLQPLDRGRPSIVQLGDLGPDVGAHEAPDPGHSSARPDAHHDGFHAVEEPPSAPRPDHHDGERPPRGGGTTAEAKAPAVLQAEAAEPTPQEHASAPRSTDEAPPSAPRTDAPVDRSVDLDRPATAAPRSESERAPDPPRDPAPPKTDPGPERSSSSAESVPSSPPPPSSDAEPATSSPSAPAPSSDAHRREP
jgi:hypothetical protein